MSEAKNMTAPSLPPVGNTDDLKAAMKAVDNARNWLTEKCPEAYRAWALECLTAELRGTK